MNNQKEIAAPKACNEKQQHTTAKKLAYLATLVAISLLLKLMGQALTFGGFKVTLVYIPWAIAAIFLGPLGGAVVALCTDVIGTFILPTGGMPLPLIAAGNMLFGMIIGLGYRYLPFKNKNISLSICFGCAIIMCTLGLNTLGLWLAFYRNMSFWQYLLIERLKQVVFVIVSAILTIVLLPVLKKIKVFKTTRN